MSAPRLKKAEIEALREVRAAGTEGLTLYPWAGFFCSGGKLHVSTFRPLAGRGLLDVIGGKIYISAAGLALLGGVP
ncbi:MAG TPA: hypothetical protein VFC47_11415 [Caulobacteraceae bacterium]|nr:hypothetical protein [Caulobacteraceae bacterium]